MCDAYAELSGMNIEKQIEKEFSGDVRNAYLTIVRLAANRQKYFATQLYGCMSVGDPSKSSALLRTKWLPPLQGPGTRDNDLIRTLVTRSEVDLELIKEEFRELYGDVLDRMIKVSGVVETDQRSHRMIFATENTNGNGNSKYYCNYS